MAMAPLSCSTGFLLSSLPASCSHQSATHLVEKKCGNSSQLLAGAIPRAVKLSSAYGPSSLSDALSRQEGAKWFRSTQQLLLRVVSSRCGLTSKGGAHEKRLPGQFSPRILWTFNIEVADHAQHSNVAPVELIGTQIIAKAKYCGLGGSDRCRAGCVVSKSEWELPNEGSSLPTIQGHKRVVLVRHGESTWNAVGRIQGSSDFAVLTPKGETQAEMSRQMLLGDNFDTGFHSPLARAKRTAEIIWDTRKNPLLPLYDLREIDLYSFQGLLKNEGKERFGEAYRTWQKDPANFEIDGRYPVRELWGRAQTCWSTILDSEGSSILVVAHNAVNQALVATATGLGPEYFRQLLQSNCGVSVLDFIPRSTGDRPPYVSINRLNQTPAPPLVQAEGRKTQNRILIVCHGATESSVQKRFAAAEDEEMNMLGVIQSNKVAELLLDVNVDLLLTGPQPSAKSTAVAIAQVQEAADCLGASSQPRYVDVKEVSELRDMKWGDWQGKPKKEDIQLERWQDRLQHKDIPDAESLSSLWERASRTWQVVLEELNNLPEKEDWNEKTVVVVSHETVLVAILGHCLGLTRASLGSFHLDTGSLSVIDFPDGAFGKGIVRCLNYTAHLGRWAVPVTLPVLADEDV